LLCLARHDYCVCGDSKGGFWIVIDYLAENTLLFLLVLENISTNQYHFGDAEFTSGQQTRAFIEAVDHYAQLGLRTLCLAWRELREDEYREWSSLYKEASSTLVDREVKCTSQCIRFCIYIYIYICMYR